MKMMKNLLLVLAIASLCNGMEPEKKPKDWVDQLQESLLGNVDRFLLFIKSEPPTPFNFGGLPQEIQQHIISLLSQYSGAASLKEAGQTITALARTNKKLNALMNEPQFCFDLIRFLAKKFKTSDEDAARAISTKEAQRQYRLQKKLYLYVYDQQWKKHKNDIKNLCMAGNDKYSSADINFIYKSGKTLLMSAVKEIDTELCDFLLEQGANINFANNKGVTALMIASESGSKSGLRESFQTLLDTHKNFNMNQQDAEGNTALMHTLMTGDDDIDVVKSLLDAGADPELANFAGKTPLIYITESWDLLNNKDEIIVLLKEAIQKKYENK